MAGLERLVDTKELKTTLWTQVNERPGLQTFIYYNERVDALTLLIVPRETRKRVHYIDDHVALLYDPQTMEVIGIRVESFQRSFLPKYAELEKAWSLKDKGIQLNDFGDLVIAVNRVRPRVVEVLSTITGDLAEKRGLKLEPVVA